MKKKIIAVLMMLSLLFAPASYAHSGRTDAYGGHHDNKNVSGLGSYHYHHGYPAHLHPNGVCPYESGSSTSSPTTSTVAKPSGMKADVADFPIVLSGNKVDNSALQYPILSYNYITYVPMTYNTARTLGLETEWDGSSLWIAEKGDAIFTNDVAGSNILGQSGAVKKVDFNVYINGQLLTQDGSYPFLDYKGVTYLPLTSDVANKLNLSVQWNDTTGIVVAPKDTKSTASKIVAAEPKTAVYNGTLDQFVSALNAKIDAYNADAKNEVKLPKVKEFVKETDSGKTFNMCLLTPRVVFTVIEQSNGNIESVSVNVETRYADELDATTYFAYREILAAMISDGTQEELNKMFLEIYVTMDKDETKSTELKGLYYSEQYDYDNDMEWFLIVLPSAL